MDKARICKASVADFSAEVRSPVLAICQVTDRGVVFTSAEGFEIGDSIELGFHVRYHDDEGGSASVRSEFITCEGQVISSMLCAGPEGLPLFEVTLLFISFKRGDSQALARFTQLEDRARRASSTTPDSVAYQRREAVGLN